jgi:hypothetical protein
LLFARDRSFTHDFDELGRYYLGYATLMKHWCSVLPPGVMIDVQYEDLVTDLDGQARAIVDHCGLEWEDACLALCKTKRQVKTASSVQVREPIYRTSVVRWRQFENFLRPLRGFEGARRRRHRSAGRRMNLGEVAGRGQP